MTLTYPIKTPHAIYHLPECNHLGFKTLVKAVGSGSTETIDHVLHEFLGPEMVYVEKSKFNRNHTVIRVDMYGLLNCLLTARIFCVSETSKVSWYDPHSKEHFKRNIDLPAILEQVEDICMRPSLMTSAKSPRIPLLIRPDRRLESGISYGTINLQLPRKLFYASEADKIESFIASLHIENFGELSFFNGKLYYAYNSHEGYDISDILAPPVYSQICQLIRNNIQDLPKITIPACPSPKAKGKIIPEHSMSIADNSIVDFIRIIFGYQLRDISELEHHMIKKYGYTMADLNQMTTREILLHQSIGDKEEAEQAQQKQQGFSFPPV